MVLEISNAGFSSSPVSPAFNHKALFILTGNSNSINGNWPASASSSAIQVIYFTSTASVSDFGSQGNIYGFIYFNNVVGSAQKWGTNSHLYGAMEFAAPGSKFLTNSGNKLVITMDHPTIGNIMTGLPGALRPANSQMATSTKTIATNPRFAIPATVVNPKIQFLRLQEFR